MCNIVLQLPALQGSNVPMSGQDKVHQPFTECHDLMYMIENSLAVSESKQVRRHRQKLLDRLSHCYSKWHWLSSMTSVLSVRTLKLFCTCRVQVPHFGHL